MPKSEKGPNSTMTEKKKDMGWLIFHKQCIYEISKFTHTWFQNYERSQQLDVRTDKRMNGQAQSPPKCFEVGGKISHRV